MESISPSGRGTSASAELSRCSGSPLIFRPIYNFNFGNVSYIWIMRILGLIQRRDQAIGLELQIMLVMLLHTGFSMINPNNYWPGVLSDHLSITAGFLGILNFPLRSANRGELLRMGGI